MVGFLPLMSFLPTHNKWTNTIKKYLKEFPGGLVVRIPGFHFHGPGSIPAQKLRSHTMWPKKKREKIDQFLALRISNLTLGGRNGRKGWKNSEAATLKPLDTCGERGSRPSSCVPGLGMTLRQSDLTHQCKADCRDVLVDSWPVMQYNKHPPESQWLWTSSVSFPHVSVRQFWV